GRPVYRAKGGGETLNRGEADTSIGTKVIEYPLDYALIGRGAALGVGKLATKVRPELGLPEKRLRLRPRTRVALTSPLHPNPVRRSEQKAVRAMTTGFTGAVEKKTGHELPVVGEHARATRQLAKQARRRERADIQRQLAPFQQAFRPLNAGEKIAVVLHAKGLKPSELRKFVEERRAEAQAAGRKAEARDHTRMLRFLNRTSDEIYNRVPT